MRREHINDLTDLSHPLFGIMYLPAYGIGAEMIQKAVNQYGREKVIPIAYGTQGQIDGISFPECMAKFAAPGCLDRKSGNGTKFA